VISLDPPLIRESHVVNGVKICSAPFDPVGTRAASDGQTVLASWHYRALVEDRTNHSPGGTDYLAGVDPSSVAIYAQSDNSVPLLKDTNNDGICDAINDAPTVGQAPTKLMLSAVNPAGSPWYATDTGANPHYDGSNPLALPPNDCHAGSDPEPGKLCSLSEMERVVPGRVQGAPPAVYAVSPSNDTNSGECDGGTWELTVIAKPGWNCIAASASDRAGGGTSTSANKGVSAPLRVCFDDGMSTPNCDPNIMPSCTQSCTINAAQLFGSDEVWPQQ
jgi:hypothetical protein